MNQPSDKNSEAVECLTRIAKVLRTSQVRWEGDTVLDYIAALVTAGMARVAAAPSAIAESEGYPGIAHDYEEMRSALIEMERASLRMAQCWNKAGDKHSEGVSTAEVDAARQGVDQARKKARIVLAATGLNPRAAWPFPEPRSHVAAPNEEQDAYRRGKCDGIDAAADYLTGMAERHPHLANAYRHAEVNVRAFADTKMGDATTVEGVKALEAARSSTRRIPLGAPTEMPPLAPIRFVDGDDGVYVRQGDYDKLRAYAHRLEASSPSATRRSTDALAWAVATFGDVALCEKERSARFIEEAVELVNALKLPLDVVQAIVERVYGRAKGDVSKELGQAQLTLELLGEVLSTNPAEMAAREFERVQSIPREEWTRRHAAKVAIGIANVAATDGTTKP